MRPRRLLIGLFVSLAALVAAGLVVVSADSVEEADPETISITLQPGDNFIGWVDESMPLDELLVQVPGIERVSAWDAIDRHEVSAVFDESGSLSGALRALEPGAAYVIRLGGHTAVEWSRPIVPPPDWWSCAPV